MPNTSEKIAQAARLLSESAREHPKLVREALAPLWTQLTSKQNTGSDERERLLLKLLCFTHMVFENSRGWTCKYCIDCLGQRCRASEAQAFIASHLGRNAERHVFDMAPRLWAEARDAADAVHEKVLAFRMETHQKRTDLI